MSNEKAKFLFHACIHYKIYEKNEENEKFYAEAAISLLTNSCIISH